MNKISLYLPSLLLNLLINVKKKYVPLLMDYLLYNQRYIHSHSSF